MHCHCATGPLCPWNKRKARARFTEQRLVVSLGLNKDESGKRFPCFTKQAGQDCMLVSLFLCFRSVSESGIVPGSVSGSVRMRFWDMPVLQNDVTRLMICWSIGCHNPQKDKRMERA